MKSEEISELLEHDSTSEFNDFTESENSDYEVYDCAFSDSIRKENDIDSVTYYSVRKVSDFIFFAKTWQISI